MTLIAKTTRVRVCEATFGGGDAVLKVDNADNADDADEAEGGRAGEAKRAAVEKRRGGHYTEENADFVGSRLGAPP